MFISLWVLIPVIIFIIAVIWAITNVYMKLLYHEEYMLNVQNRLARILAHVTAIDKSEAFETDDEVGIIWAEIKSAVLQIEQYMMTKIKREKKKE